jgi:uncharacterized protein with HEPN domain
LPGLASWVFATGSFHGYDQVDFDILWTIVESDLPPMIAELTAILEAG